MTISQVQVEQRQQGFGQLFGQVDVDVKLNMTAEADGSSLIVGVPTTDIVSLDPSQMMSFVVPAWNGGAEPSKLNANYTLELGQNVNVNQVLDGSVSIAQVKYLFSVAKQRCCGPGIPGRNNPWQRHVPTGCAAACHHSLQLGGT